MRSVTRRIEPIVLMEDDSHDTFFVRHALKKANIVNPLVCFKTAKEARDHFAATSTFAVPALFVVDVNLAGGETGIEFLRWLRQQPSPLGSTPTMMLTGSTRRADRQQAEKLGSIHFLHKPVTEDMLTRAMESLGFLIVSLTGFTTERTIERRD
jgi:CheY-like chemotaxis protein